MKNCRREIWSPSTAHISFLIYEYTSPPGERQCIGPRLGIRTRTAYHCLIGDGDNWPGHVLRSLLCYFNQQQMSYIHTHARVTY